MVRPRPVETLDNARTLAPVLRERAAEIEEARRVPLDLVDELVGAGCFRMWVPRRFGGDEASLTDGLRVIEELSRADASTGWVVMIGASSSVALGMGGEARLEKVYSTGPDTIAGGVFAPKGKAVLVDGGYRVTGQWPFASGCQHSSWLGVSAVVVEDGAPVLTGDGRPEVVGVLLPAADVEIVDTWRVSGLRGTGSHDLRLTDALCADDMCAPGFDRPVGQGSPIYRIPLFGQFSIWVAVVALGIAEGALDDVEELARGGKQPTFSPRRLAQDVLFQHALGRADTTLRAARSLLYDDAERAWDKAMRGEAFGALGIARLQAGGAEVTAKAVEVVDAAYGAGGGTSLYEASSLQRRLRDIRAVTQHAAVSSSAFRAVGALLSGEPVI